MKQFSKIKHFADKAFLVRPDRTEVLSEDLQVAEKRIELIKQTCESTSKKVALCLQCPNKDGQAMDKRIKKVPEVGLGLNMAENGRQLVNADSGSVLGEVLTEAGGIEMKVGHEMVAYEVKIEELILGPLQKLMDHDLPSIYKIKRTLSKLTSDMDTARAKLNQASRHSMSAATTGKIDNIKDDLEDTQQKVEQCRDNLAAEMYQLIARESEISQYIVNFLQYQRDYHKTIYSVVNELLPHVETILANSYHKPVFGVDLEEHLNGSGRTIAYALELCVCGLMLTGLEEEGLFRIAGSASKVKKLKAAFDAGLMDLNGLISEFSDPHVIGNALKCYLRELPKPLLTYELYNDWMDAVQVVNPQTRLQHIWTVVQKLQKSHKANFDNLRYLIKFLFELSKHQGVNKMTPANIAIVIGPNLLWTETKPDDPVEAGPMGLNMTMTHLYTSLVDQLVTYADYFFEEEVEFFVTCVRPSDDLLSNGLAEDATSNPASGDNEGGFAAAKRSQSSSSLEDHNNSPPQGSPKPVLRRKNKPAPVPPSINPKSVPTSTSSSTSSANKASSATAEISKPPSSSTPTKSGSDTSGDALGLKRLPSTRRAEARDRDGMWIPPSPNQMHNRKAMGGREAEVVTTPTTTSSSTTTTTTTKVSPPKPPQPVFSNTHHLHHGGKETNTPVQTIYATTLRHKSSFNSGASSATDNTVPSPNSSSSNTSSSNSQANSSLQYSNSLPRHFHTENSYKNQRAPRPPSVFAACPTIPTTTATTTGLSSSPPVSSSASNNPNQTDIKKGGTNINRHSQQQLSDESLLLDQQQQKSGVPHIESSNSNIQQQQEQRNAVSDDHQVGQVPSSVVLGFENIETEVRKLSIESTQALSQQENREEITTNNTMQQQQVAPPSSSTPIQHPSTITATASTIGDMTARPVPAPRSSLYSVGSNKEIPVVKERPSLMAKPRDLAKRTTHQCPNTGANAVNETKSATSDEVVVNQIQADSRTENADASSGLRNGGLITPSSPQARGRRGAGFRPTAPPNPPPKARTESTDL